MFSDTLPIWGIFNFFEISPHSPPGGDFPPKLSPDFKQTKHACICIKFCIRVIWHYTHLAYFLFIQIPPPRSPPGGEIPPNFPRFFNYLKMLIFASNLIHMFSGTIPTWFFFIFLKFPPVPPLGGKPPQTFPRFLNYLQRLVFASNLVDISLTHYPFGVFLIFSKFLLIPPLGGIFPPNFPRTLNNLNMLVFASNSVYVLSGTIPTWHIFYLFELPPPFPPGGKILPKHSPDFIHSKNACIWFIFGTNVL